jgi:hypothetical protein
MTASAADGERRLHQVSGDVVPDSISDDRRGQQDAESDERDRWLQDNRPPHHDTAW